MKLLRKQHLFTRHIAELLQYATDNSIRVSLGDAYRDPRVHGEFGEKKSYAAKYSVHKYRLALDINIHVDGVYITDGDHPHYVMLGEYWESLHPLARWGGRWHDASHFSFEHQGFK